MSEDYAADLVEIFEDLEDELTAATFTQGADSFSLTALLLDRRGGSVTADLDRHEAVLVAKTADFTTAGVTPSPAATWGLWEVEEVKQGRAHYALQVFQRKTR